MSCIIINDWLASEFFSPNINYLQHTQLILDAFKKFKREMIECMYVQITVSTEGTRRHLLGPWDARYLFHVCLDLVRIKTEPNPKNWELQQSRPTIHIVPPF